jgi:hypothetical protein
MVFDFYMAHAQNLIASKNAKLKTADVAVVSDHDPLDMMSMIIWLTRTFGFVCIRTKGKQPIDQLTSGIYMTPPIYKFFEFESYGVACDKSNVIGIDVDRTAVGSTIEDPVGLMEAILGNEKRRFYVDTPSGGRHYYFKYQGPPITNTISNLKAEDEKGRPIKVPIDIRHRNAILVGPGSTYRVSDEKKSRFNGIKYILNIQPELIYIPVDILAWITGESKLVVHLNGNASIPVVSWKRGQGQGVMRQLSPRNSPRASPMASPRMDRRIDKLTMIQMKMMCEKLPETIDYTTYLRILSALKDSGVSMGEAMRLLGAHVNTYNTNPALIWSRLESAESMRFEICDICVKLGIWQEIMVGSGALYYGFKLLK